MTKDNTVSNVQEADIAKIAFLFAIPTAILGFVLFPDGNPEKVISFSMLGFFAGCIYLWIHNRKLKQDKENSEK